VVAQDHYGGYYLMEVVLVVDHYQAIPVSIFCVTRSMSWYVKKANTTQKYKTFS